MALAPLVAAVRRRPAHWKFGIPAASGTAGPVLDGGDGGPIGLTVEIFIFSAWVDISPYVYYRNGVGVSITRGRGDETSQVQPQTASMILNNRDGRFSPRNPLGPWYGQLGRNTPLRVSRINNGIRRYRFYGEVPTWPTTSDISGNDVIVSIQAAGMLRRLRQGTQPLRSPMVRAYTIASVSTQFTTDTVTPPIAYWPCEDGSTATQIASGLSGGTPMALTAIPKFGGDTSSFAGSAPLPTMAGSVWTGSIPQVATTTANSLEFLLSIPTAGDQDGAIVARLVTAGTVARVDLVYNTASNGSLTMFAYNATGTALYSGIAQTNFNGVPLCIQLQITPHATPGSVDLLSSAIRPNSGSGGTLDSATISGTLGAGGMVVINANGKLLSTTVGHVAYQSAPDQFLTNMALLSPITAWASESPIIRFSRLCGEQNVPAATQFVISTNDPGDETAMGNQTVDTFATLLQQCPDTMFTPMWEARDQLALMFRSKGTMYNATARLTLDVSQHQLSGPLVPVDDDSYTRNDVTVSRQGGSSYQVVQTTGSMSTQSPPNGVGDYSTNYDLSLGSDSLLPDQAGWRLRFGTLDEPRYPQIPINLHHSAFTSSVDLMNAALTIDIGDRLDVINPPGPEYPPDPISQIVQGYSETLGIFEHSIMFNCTPQSPWRIGYADDAVLGHADTDGSTLAQAYPLGTETSIQVATTGAATGSPLWTTSAGDFPFDIAVGGERMTVTNITGAASPQTFTVTRSVNGVVKGQTSGTDVRLWQPMYISV